MQRIPATFELVVVAIGLTCVIGIPLGLVAGLYRDEPLGRGIMASSVLGFSLPNFWQGMMLILLFAVWLGWLPATGRGDTVTVLGVRLSILTADGWSHLIMPAINALANIALVLRLTASGVVEARSQDYVKFARAKGVKPGRIVRRHILRNILIPVVTVIGMEFGTLIAYSTITETVFAWPGMGKLLIDSVYQLDRPVVVAYVMLVTLIFVVINLVVDILYAALDPRVQLVTPLNNRHGSISQSRPHPHRPAPGGHAQARLHPEETALSAHRDRLCHRAGRADHPGGVRALLRAAEPLRPRQPLAHGRPWRRARR